MKACHVAGNQSRIGADSVENRFVFRYSNGIQLLPCGLSMAPVASATIAATMEFSMATAVGFPVASTVEIVMSP